MAEITPSGMPSYMRRCVVDLVRQGHDIGAAFAICNSTMQKAGYITAGPNQKQTAKGRERQRHFSAMKDFDEYEAAYEKLLAQSRKSRKTSSGRAANPEPCSVEAFYKALSGSPAGKVEPHNMSRTAEAARAQIFTDLGDDLRGEGPSASLRSPEAAAKYAAQSAHHALRHGASTKAVQSKIERALSRCLSL